MIPATVPVIKSSHDPSTSVGMTHRREAHPTLIPIGLPEKLPTESGQVGTGGTRALATASALRWKLRRLKKNKGGGASPAPTNSPARVPASVPERLGAGGAGPPRRAGGTVQGRPVPIGVGTRPPRRTGAPRRAPGATRSVRQGARPLTAPRIKMATPRRKAPEQNQDGDIKSPLQWRPRR